ncbi:MAG: polysaccharide deacetylase family protein [Acidimicrobiales bacterium]|nr:polysaccharide deacetylase family protein [Acidimicrobiales bacterium]
MAVACLVLAVVAGTGRATAGARPGRPLADGRGATHIHETPDPPAAAGDPVVSLTFDDGPDPRYTPRILEVLRRYGVRATFFQLGGMAERHPDLVRQVVAEGHAIANHTWEHRDLRGLDDAQLTAEVDRTTEVLEEISGQPIVCIRPPRGRADPSVVARLAARDLTSVVWSADSRDFSKPGAPSIVQEALLGTQPGAIILLHDAGGDREQTVAALPAIIEGILAQGYRIEPICGDPARDPSHRATGTLDVVTPEGRNQIRVAGDASDPDTADPIDVHVYLDGVHATTALADGAGDGGHTFNVLVGAPPGSHEVCAFAMGVGLNDENPELGCRTVEVARPQTVLDVLDVLLARVRSAAMRSQLSAAAPLQVDARLLVWRPGRGRL